MSAADEFYLDGGEEYADQPEPVQGRYAFSDSHGRDVYLPTSELDEHPRQQYGVDSWADVEQLWAEQDQQQALEAQQQELQELEQAYGRQRTDLLTQKEMEAAGFPSLQFDQLEPIAAGLAQSDDFQRAHPGLADDQLAAAAIREAIVALTAAPDETEALRRRGVRMQARGLTQRGVPDE